MLIKELNPILLCATAFSLFAACGPKDNFSATESVSETPVAPNVSYSFQAPLQEKLEKEEELRIVEWPELVELRGDCAQLKTLWKQGDLAGITNQLSSLTEKATLFAKSSAPEDAKDPDAVLMYQRNLESMARSPRLNQTGQPEQIRMAVDGIDFLLRQIGKSAGLAENNTL